MVEFAGWEMPIQYKGVVAEHNAVRNGVGIFDVSHMGRISVRGPDAESFLDYLSTNRIAGKKDFSATYTVWGTPDGGCVDDVIVYQQSPEEFFVVVNAGNRDKDLAHLLKESKNFDVQIEDHYEMDGILAIQGPQALAIVAECFPEAATLKPMRFIPLTFNGQNIILSGTGYTGSGGLEIYGPHAAITELWDLFLKQGIEPIGLAARDTLRLEMGFALYGHEINDNIAPTESVSAWTVKMKKDTFIGKEALEKLENSPQKRSEHGIVLIDKGIAREGYEVYKDDKKIGTVTSGTHSPSLNQAIAIILVSGSLQEGDIVEVQIRNKRCKAKITPLPFYKGKS